eukprot:TRINITY_DN422_c0_g1_i1.p1 TRINITY_DN422_c0_g1~~TRINITY_DN422_c0_g1_i1.p1  ORF type:complete len:544 (-),score=88.39 TRINITY_DN422_c0_g1_i1:202-1833(-)
MTSLYMQTHSNSRQSVFDKTCWKVTLLLLAIVMICLPLTSTAQQTGTHHHRTSLSPASEDVSSKSSVYKRQNDFDDDDDLAGEEISPNDFKAFEGNQGVGGGGGGGSGGGSGGGGGKGLIGGVIGGVIGVNSIITGDLRRFRPPPYFDERICFFDTFKHHLVVDWSLPEVQKALFLFARDVQKVKDSSVFCFLLGIWMAQMQTYFLPLVCEEPNSWCSIPPQLQNFFLNQSGHLHVKVKTDKQTGEVERVRIRMKVKTPDNKSKSEEESKKKKKKKKTKAPKPPKLHFHLKTRQTTTNANPYSSLPPELAQQILELDNSGRSEVRLEEVDLSKAPQCNSLFCFKNPNKLCRSADRLALCKLDSPCGTSCLRLNFNESDSTTIEKHALRVVFRLLPSYLDVLVSAKPELALFLKRLTNSSSFVEFSRKAKQDPQALRIAEKTLADLFAISKVLLNASRNLFNFKRDLNSLEPLDFASSNETLTSSNPKLTGRQLGSMECEDCRCVPDVTPNCAFCFRSNADGATCWDDSIDNEPSCCQCLVIFR